MLRCTIAIPIDRARENKALQDLPKIAPCIYSLFNIQ